MPYDLSKYYWQDGRVRLRALRETDWSDFYQQLMDEEHTFFFDSIVELPHSEETAKTRWLAYMAESRKQGRLNFAIENLEGEKAGTVSLADIDEKNGLFTMSVSVLPAFRGRGCAYSAMNILLDYAFNERRLHKFESACVEGNAASQRLHEKLGCRLEGRFRQRFFHQGRFWNELHYGLLREEYRSRREL